MSSRRVIPFARGSHSPWLAVAVMGVLAACGSGAPATAEATDPSASASVASSTDASPSSEPSEAAEPSQAAVTGPCLEAGILAALEAYKDVEVPEDPSMEEVADALEALELDGQAAEHRDGVVEALRGDTGETLDEMKLHDAMFSLIPLESEIDLESLAC